MKAVSPTLDLARRVARVRICANCPRRTPGTDRLLSDEARTCEHDCPLFVHLPQLKRLAAAADPMLGDRQSVLRRYLNRTCSSDDGPADVPSGRQREDLVRLLDEIEAG
jgi:hypothetical protein